MNKINMLLSVVLFALGVTAGTAWAQAAANYPAKAVRFIAPFPPGGSTDLLARLVALKLTEAWGQQVIVENRGGAAGTIGVELAARAAPDGYTIVMGHVGTFGVNPTLYPKLSYDAVRDFAPITVLATVPNGMAVHPSLPVKSARDFVALAKAKPGELLYASGGSGSASHLAGEYFKLLTRINMVHVPYKGTGPAMVSMISGETTMTITGMVALMPHVKSGRLKLLGVATMKRLTIMPEIPTINESGVPGYDANQWYGVLTQAAVPRDIVMKLHADMVKVLARADVKERLAADGAEPVANTPEQFAAHIKAEIARWAPVVKASGAKPD
ncbi:MAG: tripartite tricarboxylate transporter substrate binding protein [Burkholderiales bacterium]|nr:tripartite tricarboxylate transporter substrate binding protein [Burkholderiales bacterium]